MVGVAFVVALLQRPGEHYGFWTDSGKLVAAW